MISELRNSLTVCHCLSRKTSEIRKNQIKRIKNHQVGTRNSVLFLNHLGELRNLALFANRIVRVFDELILNPVEESEFIPSNIKKELKEMRREAKSMSCFGSGGDDG